MKSLQHEVRIGMSVRIVVDISATDLSERVFPCDEVNSCDVAAKIDVFV